MLGAAIVDREGVQGLSEPPPPRFERCPSGAIEAAITSRELTLQEGGDVGPAAPLVLRHTGESGREQAVGSHEVLLDVPDHASQGLAPPLHGPTLLHDPGRGTRLAVFQQVADSLADDPFVPRERGAGASECHEQPGARLSNPRRLRGWRLVVHPALIPDADPPDNPAASPAPPPRAFGEVGAARRLERRLRPARRPEHAERVGCAGLPRVGDEEEDRHHAHDRAPPGRYAQAACAASLTPGVTCVMSAR